MLIGLDHLVVLVRELDEAVGEYEGLGFRVTPGGEHADGLTRNALVPFVDGMYLELVAFVDSEDFRDNVWGWRPFLRLGGGLVDYCVASDDLEADARRLRAGGFEVDGPDGGGRRLPDGTEVRWKSARVRQEGRVMPFLIEDMTPRASRVPAGLAAHHPNGATGISRLLIAVHDAANAREALGKLAGERESGGAPRLGGHEVVPVAPEGPGDVVRRRLDALGPGPLAAEIRGAGGRDARIGFG